MEKKFILLPNESFVGNKIMWIKEVRNITSMGLKQTKNDFADKVWVAPEKSGFTEHIRQEYQLNTREFVELGLNKEYVLMEMIEKGFIRSVGGSKIRDLVDQALEEGKIKHAIALLKVIDELGEM